MPPSQVSPIRAAGRSVPYGTIDSVGYHSVKDENVARAESSSPARGTLTTSLAG